MPLSAPPVPMPSTTIGRGATSQPISLSASDADRYGGKSIEYTIEGIKIPQRNNNFISLFRNDTLPNAGTVIPESRFDKTYLFHYELF